MRIFVAGLSKSGKTTRSLRAAESVPELEYVSVSRLLRAAGCVLPVATLAQGLANQETAAQALLTYVPSKRHQIIDGHALIETLEGPLLVPDNFFEAIAPNLLIYVRDSPEQIRERRVSDRDTVAEIAALTRLEQIACERLTARLDIPMLTLDAPTGEEFSRALQKQLSAY
jgi:adenylate kinase